MLFIVLLQKFAKRFYEKFFLSIADLRVYFSDFCVSIPSQQTKIHTFLAFFYQLLNHLNFDIEISIRLEYQVKVPQSFKIHRLKEIISFSDLYYLLCPFYISVPKKKELHSFTLGKINKSLNCIGLVIFRQDVLILE